MIIWGAKSEVANLGPQASRHCPTCEKERPFHVMLQYTARHIWYVFKWVTGKQYTIVCDVCQRGAMLDARTVESKLGKSPIPFVTRWGWAFLVGLLAIAAVFGALDDSSRGSSREKYVAAPQKGDLYVVNIASLLKAPQSKYMYAVIRVRGVNPDSVEFDVPSVYYSGASGPTKDMRDGKLDQPDYFAAAPVVLTRAEIARIDKEHAIHSIDRGPQASLARAR
jgi:hypothetical protein